MIYIEPNSEKWLSLNDLPNERWKDINNYKGLYQISDYGRVKSLSRKIDKTHVYKERILKQSYDKDSYLVCQLSKNGKHETIRVHQLVGKYFVPNYDNKPLFDHIKPVEKNYCNNHYTNLQPFTYSENIKKAYKMGRKPITINCKYGRDNKKARRIIQYDLNMNKITEWYCINDIVKKYGYSHGNIVSCCKGRYKQAYGYIWKYYEEVNNE